MKKLLLFAAGLLLTLQATAQSYTLQIAGVAVTETNASNVFAGDPNLDGKVSYDDATKMLTLNNAALSGSVWYKPATFSAETEFNVRIIGACSIDVAQDSPGLYAQVGKLYISSNDGDNGVLNISVGKKGYEATAIRAFNSGGHYPVYFTNVRVTASSGNDYAVDASQVYINNSYLNLSSKAGKRAFYCDYSQITAMYSDVVYDLKTDHSRVIIVPESEIIHYNVYVAGFELNQFNAFDALQDGSEAAVWNNATKTLSIGDKVNAITIAPAYSGASALKFDGVAATVELYGEPIHMDGVSDAPVIWTNADLTFKGNAETSISHSFSQPAIAASVEKGNVKLTFDCANISMAGTASIAKEGTGSNKVDVEVIGSKLTLNDNVKNLNSFNLSKCSFLNGSYGFEDGTICDINLHEPVTTMIEIEPKYYGVTVADIQVSTLNENDVLGDGKVSFDAKSNTLILQANTDIVTTNNPAIVIDDVDLTILCQGTVHVKSENAEAIKMTGTGKKLTILNNNSTTYIGIITENASGKAAIDATGNNIVFAGCPSLYEVYAYGSYTDSPIIKANNVTINAPLSVSNDNTSSTHNIIEASAIYLHEKMRIEGSYDIVLNPTTHQLEWKTLKSDPILEILFEVMPLADNATLFIGGVEVTAMNSADVFGDGTVSYNEAGVLTLNNARIKDEDTEGLWIYNVTDFTIIVKGYNEISTKAHNAIQFDDGKVTIRGEGTNPYLNIKIDANGSWASAIVINDDLVITNKVTINASITNAVYYGVQVGGPNGYMEVDNANLRVALDNPSQCAINLIDLQMLNGAKLRHDSGIWNEITWTPGTGFEAVSGTDVSHIWIGVDEAFPTDVEHISTGSVQAVKVLRDQQLLIMHNGKTYNVQGIAVE